MEKETSKFSFKKFKKAGKSLRGTGGSKFSFKKFKKAGKSLRGTGGSTTFVKQRQNPFAIGTASPQTYGHRPMKKKRKKKYKYIKVRR